MHYCSNSSLKFYTLHTYNDVNVTSRLQVRNAQQVKSHLIYSK